jgi:hypothetical protein
MLARMLGMHGGTATALEGTHLRHLRRVAVMLEHDLAAAVGAYEVLAVTHLERLAPGLRSRLVHRSNLQSLRVPVLILVVCRWGVFVYLPGIDALRFMEQYSSYAGKTRPQMLDLTAQIVAGPNLAQLKTKADGVIANKMYTEAADFPENQAMQKAWAAKYPGRPMSADVANGYAGAQILEAALKKVNGDLSDKQKFLQAVYNMDVVTGKGRVKLDDAHDIVENMYIFQEVPQGDSVAPKLVKTYELVGRTWDRTAQELANFPFGKLKGKWPTITADQIPNLKA